MRSMHWSNDDKAISIYKRRQQRYIGKPFITWLDRLVIMGTVNVEDWDREAGKFFGFPDCCIKWFLFMGKMGIARIGVMTDYIYDPNEITLSCGYVKCPKCIKEAINNDRLRQIARARR